MKRAIVMLYNGNEANDYIVEKLAETLVLNRLTKAETLTIHVMDSDEIAKAVISQHVESSENSSPKTDPIVNAIIYIGTRFKDALLTSDAAFAVELINAVHRDDASHKLLMNAVEIIGESDIITIPKTLAKKYRIKESTLQTIKHTYKCIKMFS